ncbi:MAG: hypothetical protein ABGZ49_13650 [Akkermansiaceae bacterium]
MPLFPFYPIFLLNQLTPLLFGALVLGFAQGETLYQTDFDDFPTGDNAWAGFDGWLSNDSTSGVQAIDENLFGGALGKTAAIGFNRPNGALTAVLRPINYDPAVGGNPLLEFHMLFGIEDSTELTQFRRDDFFLSFYNMNGALLAAIRISNQDSDFGFWRSTGNLAAGGTEIDTGQEFIHGELHNLSGQIDLQTNRWTVALDGIPLFGEVLFNGTGITRTLGPIAVEWQVAAGTPNEYGDNWMLVSDIRIETVEYALPPIVFDSIARSADNTVTLSWQAYPSCDYLVEYTSDLSTWFSDLPNTSKPAPASQQTFQFTDSIISPRRFYRVRQTKAN